MFPPNVPATLEVLEDAMGLFLKFSSEVEGPTKNIMG